MPPSLLLCTSIVRKAGCVSTGNRYQRDGYMIEPAADFNHRAGYLSVAKTHDDKRIRGSYAFKEARLHRLFGWPEQAFLLAPRVMMCLLLCQCVRACKACCPPFSPEAADMLPCQEVQLSDVAVSPT